MTIPYYDEGGITIYHADCRDVMPGLSADTVIADPPYGNGTAYPSFEDTPEGVGALVAETLPMMRAVAPVVAVTPGVARIHDYPHPTWVLAWFAPGGTGSGPWGFTTWQPVLVYGPDPYLARGLGRRPDGVIAQFRRGQFANPVFDHPCPKPLRTMKWLVARTCCDGGTVVDPFMGSGTTLDAARALGRRAVGIELEERYCEIAASRLAQGVLDFGATP